jgi:putative ABC transport system permease protein
VRTASEAVAADSRLPRLSPHPPGADLVAQAGLASHVRVLSGRLPSPETGNGGTDGSRYTMDAVVTQQTATTMHLKVGQTVHLSLLSPTPLRIKITGIVAARDAGEVYWRENTDLLKPEVRVPPPPPGSDPKPYWHFALLVDRQAAAAMPLLGAGASLYWYHPLDASSLTAHDVDALRAELASFASGPAATSLADATGVQGIEVNDGISTILDQFTSDRDATQPLVLIASVGVGTTALAVLLMAGGLAAERRRGDVGLLRSRGGSLRGIFGRLAGETAACAVPAGALGTLLALLTVPVGGTGGARIGLPLLLGALVTAAGVLALPLRSVVAVRKPRPPVREDLASARPSRRRLVAELTVTVLVVGAVAALRRRGTGDGADPFLAAAPVLVAVAAALVLLRVYPLPLRWLARPASRLTGAVTHIGLARAGRAPSTNQLPLLAVLVALTITSFGGSVLAGIDHSRDRAATEGVGADARIDARASFGADLAGKVAKLPGAGLVTTARVDAAGPNPAFGKPYSLVTVDPAAYAALTRAIGLPAFPASVFDGDKGSGVLPAVVSAGLADQMGSVPNQIQTAVGIVSVRAAATLPRTPAAPGDEFIIVSARQLAQRHPDVSRFRQYSGPTVLLAMDAPGRQIDARGLRALVAHGSGEDPYVTVQVRSELRAALTDSPLQHSARRVYLAAIAVGAGYSALALLLSLLQAAPGRSTMLARLRTMGMTRRQSRRLVLLETLPQALLAAVGGVLVGIAVIPLLRPGVDLHALTFGNAPQSLPPVDVPTALRADPWSLVLPSAGLLILACAVLLAQVWVSSRRRESTELRAGERA